jgi:transposase-like protein
MTNPTFEQEFKRRLAAVEEQAREIGETWTSICRETGISRATPDRWRQATPNTVLLDLVEGHVAKKRKELVAKSLTPSIK